jgi:hypothetical protein
MIEAAGAVSAREKRAVREFFIDKNFSWAFFRC